MLAENHFVGFSSPKRTALRRGFRLFSVENNGGLRCFSPAHVRGKTDLKKSERRSRLFLEIVQHGRDAMLFFVFGADISCLQKYIVHIA